jgi:hypothetical protein
MPNKNRKAMAERGDDGSCATGSTPIGDDTRGITTFCSRGRREGEARPSTNRDVDDIKDNPPRELKISPIAAISHKSKAYRLILDLSFRLWLKNGGVCESVNDTTEKSAPKGAIDQIGECLSRIIHAFSEAAEDAKIFMAKWDIKDGFWRMDCA